MLRHYTALRPLRLRQCQDLIPYAAPQGNDPGELTAKRLHENESEGNDDDGVKDLPDQADGGRRRRSTRFGQPVVPGHPIHRRIPIEEQAGIFCIVARHRAFAQHHLIALAETRSTRPSP